MYKVRFHLAQGINYMQWQVKDAQGKVEYYEPNDFNLHLFGCRLRNQKGTAQKIHDGANKTVCAWIECDDVEVSRGGDTNGDKVRYNPRVAPYWCSNEQNVDNALFTRLMTNKREVIIKNK